MGGKDDDGRSDLDRWIDTQRAEIAKLRDELLGERNDLDKDYRNWTEDASSTIRSPFERFKGFVDSNFSALSEGFRHFPSNILELKAKMQQERDARREEEREIWRRWTGSEDSPDHIRLQIDRASLDERESAEEATYMLLRESYERNKNVPAQKIIDLYRDSEWSFGGLDQFATPRLSMGGACYYKQESVENLPSTARWGWPAAKPQWLSIDWFKRSPYSPIRLEAHSDLSDAGTKWRAAFEDLLSATLDKPMVSEEKIGQKIPHGKPQSTFYGPGLDWMLSLQCRGILPPQLPSLYKPVSLFDGFGEVRRPRSAEFMHSIDQVTSSKSAQMYPLAKRDLNLLVDEVSIKSGPATEANPLPLAPTPWRVPSTEQELYDSMPPLTEPMGPWVPVMTGNRDEDQVEAEDALWEALENKDAKTAAQCLDAYYRKHGDISHVVEEAIEQSEADERTPYISRSFTNTLHEAFGRSSLPDTDFWKRYVLYADAEEIEKDDQCPLSERRKARESINRENAARDYSQQLALLQLQNAERLKEAQKEQQQQQQLERVPEMKPQSQKSEDPSIKRPDVLSQLTTTQTTRLPDGTVTTKVVLKQKFADGREEEHETVHTTHGKKSESAEPAPKDVQKQTKEQKKNGWFWS